MAPGGRRQPPHPAHGCAIVRWCCAGFAAGKRKGDKRESLSHYSRRFGFRSEARIVSESRDAAWAAVGGGRALHPHGEVMAMCVIMQLWHCCRQRAQRPRHQSHTLESSVLHEGSLFNGLISKTGKKKNSKRLLGLQICRCCSLELGARGEAPFSAVPSLHPSASAPPSTPPERSGFCCSPSLNPLR